QTLRRKESLACRNPLPGACCPESTGACWMMVLSPGLGTAAGPGDGARLRQEPHRPRGCLGRGGDRGGGTGGGGLTADRVSGASSALAPSSTAAIRKGGMRYEVSIGDGRGDLGGEPADADRLQPDADGDDP